MMTPFDQIDYVYSLLNSSELKTVISGGIYKSQRPDDSVKEDVVINSISVPSGDEQIAYGNVNIHVPTISVTQSGKTSQLPNHQRMAALSYIAQGILKQYYNGNYNIGISSVSTYKDLDSANNWYVNIRYFIHYLNTD